MSFVNSPTWVTQLTDKNIIEDINNKVLSATEIKRYMSCPRMWFYQNVVGVKDNSLEFGPREQGTYMHDCLERFYKELQLTGKIKRVTLSNVDECKVMMELIAVKVWDEFKEKYYEVSQFDQFDEIERKKLTRNIVDFIDADAIYLPGFTPYAFEYSFGSKEKAACEYGGVQVKGFIDRIDIKETNDGPIAVISDYKRSSVHACSYWKKKKGCDKPPLDVQLPLYATVFAKQTGIEVVGGLYRTVNIQNPITKMGGAIGGNEFTYSDKTWAYLKKLVVEGYEPSENLMGLGIDNKWLQYRAYLEGCEASVAEAMTNLKAGIVSFNKNDDESKYCPIKATCGVCDL